MALMGKVPRRSGQDRDRRIVALRVYLGNIVSTS